MEAVKSSMKRTHLFDRLNRMLTEYYAMRTVRQLLPHIKEGDAILDIGSGYGKQATLIKERVSCAITGIDVVDYNQADISFQHFDGVHIPFPDNAFDVSYLAFVLHHAKEPIPLLTEALRVSRRAVVIFEDTPKNAFDKLLDAFHGWSFNKYYKLTHKAKFLSKDEWMSTIKNIPAVKNADAIQYHRFWREVYFPISRTKFVVYPQT